jgi:polar amino acid transport system substrate-binding protein
MPDFSLRGVVAAVCLAISCLTANAQVGPSAAGTVAPAGTLRAAFLATNPVQGRTDPQTGAVSGPAVDLTRELGKRLGVPVSVVGVPGMRAMVDGFMAHTFDIAFLAFDPARAGEADFSQVYSLSWSSYIVPSNSPFHVVADVDRAGVRIGAASGDSPELYLSRNLKNAQLKKYTNPPAAEVLRMLAAGEFDVYAANRQRLIEMAASTPTLRVLPDNYFAVRQAIIVAKGNSAALEVINRFLDEARASGLIQSAIDRAKLTGAVDVAPAEKK